MKLVAAKCPNCGANIDVDKDSDSTKCEFCKSKIIVDDAIAKYKVEISGKVEVENLPKIENYMKLGDRYFDDKEYNDAFKQYEKACELDPDNAKAVLRKGLSKSYSTGYGQFDLKAAINGMKNAYKLLKKQEADSKTVNSYIIECYSLVYIKQAQIIDFYSKNNVDINGMNLIMMRLRMCIGELQYLKTLVEDNKGLVVTILNSIIDGLTFMLSGLYYTNGYYQNGNPNRVIYKISDRAVIKNTLDSAIVERNELDPAAAKVYEVKKAKEIQTKQILNIMWIVLGVLFFILCTIIVIVAVANPLSEPFEKKWISDQMTIEFIENERVVVTLTDGTQTEYNYEKECVSETSSCNISIIEAGTHKYELYFRDSVAGNGYEQTLCLKEGEECKVFFEAE